MPNFPCLIPPSPDRVKSDQLYDRAENSCPSANRRPTAATNYREPKLRLKPVVTKMPEHADTSYCLSDEDVALILVRIKNSTNVEAEEERDRDDEDGDYSDEDDETFCVNRARSQGEEYRCETCNKCFRSYQALGGHRASHTNSSYANRKIFHCPYCSRMFDSGQALGGHKKVHHLPNHNSGHANHRFGFGIDR